MKSSPMKLQIAHCPFAMIDCILFGVGAALARFCTSRPVLRCAAPMVAPTDTADESGQYVMAENMARRFAAPSSYWSSNRMPRLTRSFASPKSATPAGRAVKTPQLLLPPPPTATKYCKQDE